MTPTGELALALKQIDDIERFCDVCERFPMPPRTGIPPDPVRAAGLDPDTWHGLGVVGLWAVIDAFAERCGPPNDTRPLHARVVATKPPPALVAIAGELDDIRNLYAHNFAGVADWVYFSAKNAKRRRVFEQGRTCPLSSGTGTCFDGERLVLTIADLRYYARQTAALLAHLNGAWP